MNPASSRKLVLVSFAAMGVVVLMRRAQGKGSLYRQVWAVSALGLVLATMADFMPQVAGPLALLIAMTYIVGAQDEITNLVHGAIGAKTGETGALIVGGNITSMAGATKAGAAASRGGTQ